MADRGDPAPPLTIVIADDHTVMRNGLRLLLEADPEFQVVAEAGTMQGVFREVRSHRPDVLLLDLNMPGGSSVLAIPKIVLMSPQIAIVVLTIEHDPHFRDAAIAAGARGYVLKDAAANELVGSIRTATARTRTRPGPPAPPPAR